MAFEPEALPGRVVVWDIGKTLAKLSLWDAHGRLLAQRSRTHPQREHAGLRVLDVEGIERRAVEVLREFAQSGPVAALVPVAHGAAAALLRGDALAHPVLDYEDGIPETVRRDYESRRDAFAHSGSPRLPDGLNLGAQLFRLQRMQAVPFDDPSLRIVPWPQFWAWRLCGVAASEVSSLGCHSDLWNPYESQPSALARTQGWATRLAPLRRAGDVLGTLSPEWAERTGLSPALAVHCGVHDSNAALYGARGFAEIGDGEATVLSTGTWFVAMRSVTPATLAQLSLDEARDCLINVDVDGRPVPSARFMGGREIERLARIDLPEIQHAMLDALPRVVADQALALPTWAHGVGPYPRAHGRWIAQPRDAAGIAATVALYAALVSDVLLEQIGSRASV
ncbi:MAG TPA: carbohydrate kinase, partial [Solimonas sp.]|nr:carbohydrate kinase [Solimonas sp.]